MKKLLTSMIVVLTASIMSAQCVINNAGFETWGYDTVYNNNHMIVKLIDEPSLTKSYEWLDISDFNDLINYAGGNDASLIDTLSIYKSSDAHTGNYSLGIQINPDEKGGMILYQIACSTISDRLVGYYKFTVDHKDTLMIDCSYFKNGIDNVVSEGTFIATTSTNGWQKFSIPISAATGQADSVAIIFSISGSDKGRMSQAKVLIDDLAFKSGSAAGTDELSANRFQVYPNPSTGMITINGLGNSNTTVNIVDVLGNIVMSESVNAATKNLDISSLSKGMYFVQINNESSMQSSSIILQ